MERERNEGRKMHAGSVSVFLKKKWRYKFALCLTQSEKQGKPKCYEQDTSFWQALWFMVQWQWNHHNWQLICSQFYYTQFFEFIALT